MGIPAGTQNSGTEPFRPKLKAVLTQNKRVLGTQTYFIFFVSSLDIFV